MLHYITLDSCPRFDVNKI